MSRPVLHDLLSQAPGAWSACVCAVTGQQLWAYQERVVRPAASLIKVPLAMAVIDAAPDQLDRSVQLRADERVEGAGPLDLHEHELHNYVPSALTIRRLIEYALIFSDNTAANVLINQIGIDAVNRWLAALGLHTRMSRTFMDYAARTAGRDNTTTAADMCMILHKIVQPRYAFVLHIMERAVGDGKLEAGLPEGTRIAHKVGDLPDVEHDAGIIYAPNGAYIVALLGAELRDTAAARRTIAQASRLIWTSMTER